MSEFQ